MAGKCIFLIFVDSFLNFCKASRVRAFTPCARAYCTDLYENLVGGQVLSYDHLIKIRAKMRVHEAKTHVLVMPYKNSETSQQKSRKCVLRPFYSLLSIRPKYYESS